MAANQFAGILACSHVAFVVPAIMEKQVITHAAADKALFYARQSVYGMVNVEQWRVVGTKVGAYLRINARRPFTLLTQRFIASSHAVHIRRGTAKVAQISLEVRHGHDFFHLVYYAALAARRYELSLVGAYGAECTAPETSAMYVDGMLNHVVCRDALVLIFRVRQPCVRQVIAFVNLLGCHRRVRRVHNGVKTVHFLKQAVGVHHV